MSEELKHKLASYAVVPPEGVWQKIATALDDEVMSGKFPSGLYDYEVAPPPALWGKIAGQLEDTDLPATVAEKLSGYQANPPSGTWDRIVATLDAEKQGGGRLIRLQPGYARLLRVAAAVAVLAILTFGAVRLFDHRPSDNGLATGQNGNAGQKTDSATNGKETAGANTTENNNAGDDANAANGDDELAGAMIAQARVMNYRQAARVPEYDITNIPASLSESFSTEDMIDREHVINYEAAPISYDPSKIGEGNRYLLFISPDGYLVRISKRLAGMVGCLYDEGNGDEQCRDKVKEWREKMARSSISPAPGNFMDILDMLKTLEENRP